MLLKGKNNFLDAPKTIHPNSSKECEENIRPMASQRDRSLGSATLCVGGCVTLVARTEHGTEDVEWWLPKEASVTRFPMTSFRYTGNVTSPS
ncbi:hypothetical protein ACOMHN_020363 [Nucella lapillus]